MIKSLVISNELGIYAYGAFLIACAKSFNTPLLTLDQNLNSKADEAGIRSLEI